MLHAGCIACSFKIYVVVEVVKNSNLELETGITSLEKMISR